MENSQYARLEVLIDQDTPYIIQVLHLLIYYKTNILWDNFSYSLNSTEFVVDPSGFVRIHICNYIILIVSPHHLSVSVPFPVQIPFPVPVAFCKILLYIIHNFYYRVFTLCSKKVRKRKCFVCLPLLPLLIPLGVEF